MKIKKLISILLFLLGLTLANAISFYEGNVVIKSIKIDADIQQNANVVLSYTLSGNEKVNLNFDNVPDSAQITINGQNYGKSFDLEVNGEVSIVVAYSTELGTETAKDFSLSPNIMFNNAVNANRIGSYAVRIKMPAGVNELLSSSDTPSTIETESGKKIFNWEKSNAYVSTLSISWHSLNINIDVERIIPNDITDEFIVKNIIRNNGGTINNINLVQSWLESDFEPVSPMEEFERIQSGNDIRLEWKKAVASIPSGNAVEFSYKLKVLNRGENVVFRPLYVYAGNDLVKIVDKQEYSTKGVNPPDIRAAAESVNVVPPAKPVEEVPETVPAYLPPEILPSDAAAQALAEEQNKSQAGPEIPENVLIQPSPEEGKAIAGKRNLIWVSAIIIILLLVVLLFLFLNRRKNEGVRF